MAHLLAIAEAIKGANVTFKKEVVLAFFAGEEQGLLGSAAYASESHRLPFEGPGADRTLVESLHEANATVLLQTQADMLGYHDVSFHAFYSSNALLHNVILPQPLEPMQLAFPASIGTPEAAYLLGNLSKIVSLASCFRGGNLTIPFDRT